MIQKLMLVFCMLAVSFVLMGQKVSLHSLYEQRSSGEGYGGKNCDFGLLIEGPEVGKYKKVKVGKLIKAVDDVGTNMLNEDDMEDFKYEEISQDAILTVRTGIPSRKATMVKELSGELHFYGPTEANGGVVTIPNYQSLTNKNLIPIKNELIFMYVTQESLEQFGNDHKQKKEADLNKMSEKEKLIYNALLDASKYRSDFGDDPNSAMFVVDGEYESFVDLYFVDAKGNKVDRNGYMKVGGQFTYYYEEPPSKDWKLVLNIITPESMKVVPFILRDIILP